MRLDTDAPSVPKHHLLSLNPMRHLELALGQSWLTFVTKFAQYPDCRRQIGITDKEIQIPESSKANITICLKRQNGALKRNGGNLCFRQCIQQACEFVEKRLVCASGVCNDCLK